MARIPNGVILLRNVPVAGSNTLPCQATRWTSRTRIVESGVPGAMRAIPAVSPCGIGPAGLRRNRRSSCDCERLTSGATVRVVMISLLLIDDQRGRGCRAPTGNSTGRFALPPAGQRGPEQKTPLPVVYGG